jgi:hypothetical protein
MYSISNQNSETFGIIFREKDTIPHSKGKMYSSHQNNLKICQNFIGINKLLFYDMENFFSGGRDGVIKLWNKSRNENVLINSSLKFNSTTNIRATLSIILTG